MAPQFRKARLVALTLTLLLAIAAQAADAPRYVVIVPVANMYSGPSQDTDVVSQAIYASNLGVLEEQENWIKVRTLEDEYVGWVPRSVLLSPRENSAYAATGNIAEVRALMANLYREPDVTLHAPLLTVPFETRLEVASAKADEERWVQVRLPDSRLAWIQHGDIALRSAAPAANASAVPAATRLSIDEMIALGKRFLGLPYTWGGRSPFGYDCSGFMQMLMRQRGYNIPRDADVQAAWNGFVEVKRADLRPGDLLYFGSKGQITHTGMYIGDGQFIHATTYHQPVVQISRLDDQHWTRLLVAQRRVKQ